MTVILDWYLFHIWANWLIITIFAVWKIQIQLISRVEKCLLHKSTSLVILGHHWSTFVILHCFCQRILIINDFKLFSQKIFFEIFSLKIIFKSYMDWLSQCFYKLICCVTIRFILGNKYVLCWKNFTKEFISLSIFLSLIQNMYFHTFW